MQNTPPDKPSGDSNNAPGGAPGGSATSASHSGATTFTEATTSTGAAYSSTTGGENALLVTTGESTITDSVITKSGDESSESSDFYGTNAAILATGGVLNIDGGIITTTGAHANGVFAYGDGKIVVKNTTIKTNNNNSGGIMVTGGGTLMAENLTVETFGNSSAPIRSDRGGGTMTISGGSFTSTGVGSPAIYSTAEVYVKNGASLVSKSSEGVVIEGSNSVHLENITLTDTNNSLNGNSETYKNIFIYQSMSGDAEEGTGTFSATNSVITTNQGDTFFVTNTTANISLENNRFANNDSASVFLRAGAGKWGSSGNNGGHVKLSLNSQVVEGDIVLDSISSLSMSLLNSSYYMGAINSANTATSATLSLDATSQLILAGDTYLSEFTNADTSNQNVYSNGYKLYVAGSEVAINGSEIPETPEVVIEETPQVENTQTVESATVATQETNYTPFIVGGAAILVIIGAVIAFVIHNKKKTPPVPPASPKTPQTPPDFSQFDDGSASNNGTTFPNQ
ncbi:hypothetical protein IJH29_00740 [Candidatus Saccharibacteria bacterium]|nr:hypothetical protein [Candidatus Saccharibacteria bacterium]